MNSIILTTLKEVFPTLEQDEIEALFHASEQIQSEAKETIISPNDSDYSLYVCMLGIVKVNYEPESGEELSITYLAKGDIFGELSAIDNQQRSAHCIAKTDCTLLKIPSGVVKSLLATNQNFNRSILLVLIKRIRETDHKLFRVGRYSSAEIIADELIKLAEVSANNKDRGEVPFIPKHQELALLAIVSREQTTRTMTRLKNGNFIYKENDKLVIPSISKLRAFI